jgi:hypothetical protein
MIEHHLGLVLPSWSPPENQITKKILTITKKKSATSQDHIHTSGMLANFSLTSSPACLQQSNLIASPGNSTSPVVQIAISREGLVWCGALWKKRIRWRRLSFNTQRISFRAEINEEPQMMSGPYRLVQSQFFGASHGRDVHKIRCTGLEHNLKTMFVKRFGDYHWITSGRSRVYTTFHSCK